MGHTALNLTTADLCMFARFGVDADLLLEAGVRRVTDAEAREQLNSHHRGDLAGILIPYVGPAGHVVTARVRRDHPEVDHDGKPQAKYLAATGDSPHIYFGPGAGSLLTDTSTTVVIVEAEKAALSLAAAARRAQRPLLVIAVGGCWGWRTQRAGKAIDANGARVNQPGVQPDLGHVAWAGRDVVILFDSNAATNAKVRQARRQLAEALQARGARVRIGTVPAEPGVNGPDDFRAVHDDVALLALIDDAIPLQPASVDDLLDDCGLLHLTGGVDATTLEAPLRALKDALRGADAIRRTTVRSRLLAALKAAKVPGGAALVDAALGSGESPEARPATIVESVEPWPDPVDGAEVLDSALRLIQKYVLLTYDQAVACVLWLAHAFTLDAFDHSPILAVLSPERRCGKSTLLSVLGGLADRVLQVANVTTAVLFRIIEAERPTLMLDEADTWLRDDRADLRGVVNSGWARRGACVLRCDGDDAEPKTFSTWTPKVIAAIGALPDTVADRSIPVLLRRKLRSESVAVLRSRALAAEAGDVRRQFRRWADDAVKALAQIDPEVPEALNDRAADSWRPLLAVASYAGGEWPDRARAAALALSAERDGDTSVSLPVLLLGDLKPLIESNDDGAVETSAMIEHLIKTPDRPWADWKGKGLNGHQLARLLARFDAVPAKIRIGQRTSRGYRTDVLLDAITRYCPSEVEHRNNPNESGPLFHSAKWNTKDECSTFTSGTNPIETGVVPVFHFEGPNTAPGEESVEV